VVAACIYLPGPILAGSERTAYWNDLRPAAPQALATAMVESGRVSADQSKKFPWNSVTDNNGGPAESVEEMDISIDAEMHRRRQEGEEA